MAVELPSAAAKAHRSQGPRVPPTCVKVLRNILLIVFYVFVTYILYNGSPFGASSSWLNVPAWPGWDTNHTAESWGTDGWSWDLIDCLYFAMVTMTTVGYGDMPTLRQDMRLVTMGYGFIGVTMVAGSITVIADWFQELGRKRFISRQRTILQDAQKVSTTFAQFREGGTGGTLSSRISGGRPRSRLYAACCKVLMTLKALRLTGLFVILCVVLGELENADVPDCGFLSGWRCSGPHQCELWKAGALPGDSAGTDRGYCWSWIDQLYYAVITYMTIGYGDVTAHTKHGKAVSAFLVTFGLLAFTMLLAQLNDMQQSKRLGAEKSLLERIEELEEVIEQDDDGTVTKDEYVIFNLKKMGKVDDDTLGLLREQFTALDADGSGALDVEDIAMLKSVTKILAGPAGKGKDGASDGDLTRDLQRQISAAHAAASPDREESKAKKFAAKNSPDKGRRRGQGDEEVGSSGCAGSAERRADAAGPVPGAGAIGADAANDGDAKDAGAADDTGGGDALTRLLREDATKREAVAAPTPAPTSAPASATLGLSTVLAKTAVAASGLQPSPRLTPRFDALAPPPRAPYHFASPRHANGVASSQIEEETAGDDEPANATAQGDGDGEADSDGEKSSGGDRLARLDAVLGELLKRLPHRLSANVQMRMAQQRSELAHAVSHPANARDLQAELEWEVEILRKWLVGGSSKAEKALNA